MGRSINAHDGTPASVRFWNLGLFRRLGTAADPDGLPPAEPPASEEFPAPGQQLRDGRMQRGLSLKDVSTRTKIGLGHLQNIEEGNFARLPPRVYLKGFLLSFARAVRLPDADAVTEAYLARFDEAQAASPPH